MNFELRVTEEDARRQLSFGKRSCAG